MKHLKLTIGYDGTAYGGWQLQPNRTSVQGLVEAALAELAGQRVVLHGSGRTDAGVHARAQVASCAAPLSLKPATVRRALNAHLPVEIRILRVQEVDAAFHARFSARGKEYRYQIDVGAVADPFLCRYAWHHPRPLDVPAMRRAARLLQGRHDFAALSAKPMRPVESTVRTISRLAITRAGQLLVISIQADGFLYKMVRTIVGALVKVGEGKLTGDEMRELLRAGKRVPLVVTAPAHGLFLWRAIYKR